MTRLLLAAATLAGAAFLAAPAQAQCDLHCTVANVCGSEDHCGPVQRCHYWTDYPTCIYP
jgi:hypothetical protein